MKTIGTAFGAFLTGTEIADAVTAYGLALARIRALDVVDIPFVAGDRSVQRVQLRIGWMVEILVTSDGRTVDELIEPDTILDLISKSRALAQRRDATPAT